MKNIKVIFLCLFLLGIGVRAIDVWRPVNGSVRYAWRECDIAAIARNYYREDMNLFKPRIDWRGDGPGLTEMEFPIYPWLIAVSYKIFGLNEVTGRLISFIFSLLTMAIFFKLSRLLLPDLGAVSASVFFLFSPLAIRISDSLQPEGLMFLSYLLAVYSFVQWLETNRRSYYFLALLATALAVLSKATSAHIGFLFALLVLDKWGLFSLRRVSVWTFAVCSLLPAAVWYIYAHDLWLTYGNSLGVSNEYHWVGWDVLTNLSFLRGLARAEIFHVWMPTGLVVAGFGLILRKSEKGVKYSIYWLCAIFVFYLITARTSGDSWAIYYHIVSVPPAAILFGAGIDAVGDLSSSRHLLAVLVIVSAILTSCIIGLLIILNYQPDRMFMLGLWMGLSILFSLVFIVITKINVRQFYEQKSTMFNILLLYFFLFCITGTFIFKAFRIAAYAHPNKSEGLYECAKTFATHIPENELIVASGGSCVDDTGYPVAYNASYMFYWMDRKGFSICHEEQSLEKLRSFIQRGAHYFVAEKSALLMKPGFEYEVRKAFPLAKGCSKALLFDLSSVRAE